MIIREASIAEDDIVVRHYLEIWRSYGTPEDHFSTDAKARVLAYLEEGRAHHRLKAFLALEGTEAIGSVSCQLMASPYPEVVDPARRRYGYIWSVWVLPAHRRKGVAGALMNAAIDELRRIGCTTAVLNASEAGMQLYLQLGFKLATEMRLDLTQGP